MKSLFTISFLTLSTLLSAQQLYQIPAGAQSHVSSFENLNGLKGQGGQSNATAKGHAFESLKAGETKTLLDIKQPGILQRIWCTISDRSPLMLRSLRLQMYWDGATKPAVDVPFGDFFSAAFKPVAFQSALFSDPEAKSFNCTIPMPFRKAAKVTLTNESSKDMELLFFDIDFITLPSVAPDNLYFHACWTRTKDAPLGEDAILLPTVKGKGRFLGVSVAVNINPVYRGSWWGEGEVKAWMDGDTKYPTINGTGTEDYIGTGWGEGLFSHQFQGCLIADFPGHQYSFYRFHVPDPIYFDKDCRVSIQQIGGWSGDSIQNMLSQNLPLKPVSVAGPKGLVGLFEKGADNSAVTKATGDNWINFYRSDDYAATAYFYLDKSSSNIAPLSAVAIRCQGVPAQ